jgi:hypothetical protein
MKRSRFVTDAQTTDPDIHFVTFEYLTRCWRRTQVLGAAGETAPRY